MTPGGGIADLWADRDAGANKPVLYFPARAGKPNIHPVVATPPPPPGYLPSIPADPTVAGQSLYNVLNNITPAPPASVLMHVGETATNLAEQRIHVALGDVDLNGVIDGTEHAVDLPYLLWSAGPDRVYGPIENPPTADNWADCDDVTNFR